MVDRVDSRTLSSATLVAGVDQLEGQQVKQEPMDEKAAMEKELQDSCNVNWKCGCPTKMVGFQTSIF